MVQLVAQPTAGEVSPFADREEEVDQILRLVLERAGIDLRLYRRKTVERRLLAHLQKLGCQSLQQCAERLAEDPEAAHRFVQHVMIKVSRFFRNAEVFARLDEEILPQLVRRCGASGLRIWSAGCGNGEEPYSLAILLTELAGRTGEQTPALIYGSDVDEEALARARQGLYPQEAFAETPPEILSRYFSPHPGRYGPQWELTAALRESVRYVQHNLLAAEPLLGGLTFDLIFCRNVLIYFERPAQDRVFRLLVGSLVPGGYLCLGEAEQLPRSQQVLFETIDRRAGLYRRLEPPVAED